VTAEPDTPTQVALLECNLDDMPAEALGYALDRLLEAGALDAWYTPIQAKKSRPAVLLSVLCRLEERERLARLVLTETTSLGVRWQRLDRTICQRSTLTVETRWGSVLCKVKRLDGQVLSVKPEHDDCARIARERQIPLEAIVAEARAAAWRALESTGID